MSNKIRKQIYIEAIQDANLKRMAATSERSEAEIIREAIDHYMLNRPFVRANLEAWKQELQFITQLIAKGPIQGSRTWQREDLYDR